MRKIDDTKKTIGVADLKESERKKIFSDLTKAGGKVINDPYEHTKKPAGRGAIDREKQKEYKKRIDEHRRNMQSEGAKKSTTIKKSPPSGYRNIPSLGFFSNLKLNFRLRIFKICQSGYSLFHHKFIKNLYGSYRTAFLKAKLQYSDIFKKNITESKEIIDQLDSQNPIFFKLMEIMGEIDDIPEIDIVQINISELQQPLMEIFKALSLLHPYENTLLNAYLRAIDLKHAKDSQKHSTQKKVIKNALYIIFNELYPRLHWLMCHYYKSYVRLGDIRTVESLLNISPVEKPTRTNVPAAPKTTVPRKIEKHTEAAEETEPHQKQAVLILPQEVKKGLEIMGVYNYEQLRKEFDPKGNFESIKSNDKAFIAILIFNEFIKEFSFILNTNKIKFISSMGSTNHQANLKALYYEINKPMEALKIYSASSVIYEQAKREKPINSSQYINYANRLQEITSRCENDGKNVRILIKDYMGKLADEMKILSDDMDGKQVIIQNPQEPLRMDTAIEGNRKLNGKKVFEAINLCYYFASAFVYRLSVRGDLSGDLEFSEEELARNKNIIDSNDNITDSDSVDDDAAEKTDKSIFDELEDFEEEQIKVLE